MTITEFLLARVAEDEKLARTVSVDAWWWEERYVDMDDPYAAFPVIHGPARVLAECAAKRAIIEQHKDWPVLVEKKPEFIEAGSDPQSMAYRVTQEMVWLTEREYVKRFGTEAPTTNMIRALAAVYADHPDYQQDWA